MIAPGLTDSEYAALPLSARIYAAAARFLGMRYATRDSDVRYPYHAGTLPESRVGGDRVNCSPMTTAILMAVYDKPWTPDDYGDLVVFAESLQRYPKGDSPIRALERYEIAQRIPAFTSGDWHLVQYWNRRDANGHAVAAGGGHSVLVYFEGSDCWTLEATSKGGIGPKFSAKKPRDFTRKALLHIARLWP